MNQRQYQTEWQDPQNWAGPKFLSVYFSKKDTRVWVPKQMRWTGWTLNLARTAGVVWLVFIIAFVAIAPLALGALNTGR